MSLRAPPGCRTCELRADHAGTDQPLIDAIERVDGAERIEREQIERDHSRENASDLRRQSAWDPASGGSIYAADGFRLVPKETSIKPFIWVLGDVMIQPNTTITITLLLGLSVIVPAAYALSRREFIMRRKVLFGYVLFTQVGGGLGIASLIALYAIFQQADLLNSKIALAAYYAATAVPFNTWLLKTYMGGIPVSYEEAALVDGAPPWRVVVEVILPLSEAGLATVTIFTFLAGWMEFVVAQLVLSSGNFTLPVGLFSLVEEYSIPWARFSAFALTFASPVMLVYLFAQRYIEGCLSFSGMKG